LYNIETGKNGLTLHEEIQQFSQRGKHAINEYYPQSLPSVSFEKNEVKDDGQYFTIKSYLREQCLDFYSNIKGIVQ
jgi:hypothetical protein